jgi:uncharacterized protein YegL
MPSLNDEVEIGHQSEPKVATVLLVDTSESMEQGNKIGELNAGLMRFRDDAAEDELTRKRAEIAVLTFGGEVSLASDFVTVDDFVPPELTADGATPMGQAILEAVGLVAERTDLYAKRGILAYTPWIILITDGVPTDMKPGDDTWHEVTSVVHGGHPRDFLFYAVGADQADMTVLQQLAPPNSPPKKLQEDKWRELFEWISRSQQRVSASKVGDQIMLPPTSDWEQVST